MIKYVLISRAISSAFSCIDLRVKSKPTLNNLTQHSVRRASTIINKLRHSFSFGIYKSSVRTLLQAKKIKFFLRYN